MVSSMQANSMIATDPAQPGADTGQGRLMAMIAALYFTQGLPMGLSMEALPVMMRQAGVPLEIVAFVPLASLPWIIKLFWAPLVDNNWIPRLGRRRTWILSMQIILVISFIALGLSPLEGSGLWLAITALAIGALASATQDTATDGLAAETLAGRNLSAANAFQIGGMMAGFIVGGGGVLMLVDYLGQVGVMALLALFPLCSILLALIWKEERSERPSLNHPDRARLAATFCRPGITTLLLLAAIYGGAHAGGMSVSRLLLVDLGWSNSETGLAATIGGIVMIVAGCPLGAALTNRNRWQAVVIGMISAAATFLCWSLLADDIVPTSWLTVLFATGLLSITSGIIAVSAATIIMAFGGAGKQAGTDVTVLQSANVTGEMIFASLAVWMAGTGGFGITFIGAAAFVFCAALLVGRLGGRLASA
jgi:MFS transporter, PAT family, beta-lactamase induction signal transducer AmpG